LTDSETQLLSKVLGSAEGGEPLAQQLGSVQVRDDSVPTSLRLIADDALSTDRFADGPVPGRFPVTHAGELVGEVIVWVKGGRLAGLEYAWLTDVAPSGMPDANDVVTAGPD